MTGYPTNLKMLEGEWAVAVLEDLAEFFRANKLIESERSLNETIGTLRRELEFRQVASD
jgi:hypothetical protein